MYDLRLTAQCRVVSENILLSTTTINIDLQRCLSLPFTELNVKYSALDAYSEILEEVSSRMVRSGGMWRCTVCNFESRLKSDTFKHVEGPVFAISVGVIIQRLTFFLAIVW